MLGLSKGFWTELFLKGREEEKKEEGKEKEEMEEDSCLPDNFLLKGRRGV